MAGIGVELKKLLETGSCINTAQAYGYAGILGSGPWIIAIISILSLNFLIHSQDVSVSIDNITQFQVSVTYLIVSSLIFSSIVQHSFTRYISDCLFDKRTDKVMPNFNGMLLLLTLCSGIISIFLTLYFLPNKDFYYQVLICSSFVIFCDIWFVANLLSGLKNYKTICLIFLLGYTTSVLTGYLCRAYGLNGLMTGFWVGQFILLIGLLFSLYKSYPSDRLIEFDCLKLDKIFPSLIFSGLCCNIGVWIDKITFWYTPTTSHNVIGLLRASPIYDVPIFLAFITAIPGIAASLLFIETDFSDCHTKYHDAICKSGTLEQILDCRYKLVAAAKNGILNIIKIQAVIIFTIFTFEEKILHLFNISTYYSYLLNIDMIATALLVIFLCLLNIMFYLDRRKSALIISIIFMTGNFLFTLITLHLGAFYFGYGFAAALLTACVIGTILLDHDFDQLEYKIFTKYE